MSDTEEYVQPPINVGFTEPMKLAREPEQEEPTPIESSPEALHEAAEPLVDNGPEADVITFRDSETGKPRPANETVTAEQAAREVAAYRNANEDAREQQGDQAVRDLVDHIQGNAANPDLQPTAQQPQQQVQPEPAPQPEQAAQQYPPDVDPDIARVLAENPKVREALQAEVQQIHSAARAYTDGLRANAELTARVIFSDFPELIGVTQEQLPGALKAMQHQNPERALAAVQRIQTANTAVAQWQQAQQVQSEQAQRQYQQQFNEYAKAEDIKAEKLLPGVDNKKLGEAAVSTLRNIGFSDQDMRRAYNGEATIHLRDHRVQVLLAKAALYDQAQAGLHNATRNPAPPHMRPGVSGARSDDYSQSELSGLTNRLNQTHSVKDAARLLAARRANRG